MTARRQPADVGPWLLAGGCRPQAAPGDPLRISRAGAPSM